MGRFRKYPVPEVNKEYGSWTVLTVELQNRSRNNECLCRCKCGTVKPVREQNLIRGLSTNCGCERDKKTGNRFRKHGESRGNRTPEYIAWRGMITRCTNKNERSYADYGARGILVCERWTGCDGYKNFLADMGRRPGPGYSIERKENNGNYEPSNCRWATAKEQARNKRSNRIIEANGQTRCLAEWAEQLRLDARVIQALIRRGVRMIAIIAMIEESDKSEWEL